LGLGFGVIRAHISLATVDPRRYDAVVLQGLRLILDACRRLARKPHSPDALADNARRDPFSSVRAQNLLTLVRTCPRDELTSRTLRAACQDPSGEARACAGAALGPDGDATLIEVAADESVEDLWRAKAIAALGPRLPSWRARTILARALRPGSVQTAQAC